MANEYTALGTYNDAGVSGADKQAISQAQAAWNAAKAAGDQAGMDAAHATAESIRAGYGYSGGGDGSDYIALPKQQTQPSYPGGSVTGSAPQVKSSDEVLTNLKSLLDEWKSAAGEQSQKQIDYATQTGVQDLQRAEQDAQAKFKTNQEQIAAEAQTAMDNSALYSEMRGDKGGIGQAQYNAIQNTAAINAQTVKSEQTKLSTDIAREIADLRAKGEFEKADAILEISQSALSQLIGIEQWAANYGLSVAQFQESIREWENELREKIREFDMNFSLSESGVTGYYNGNPTYEREKNDQATMSNAGTALLSAGVMPSNEQLAAMGMTVAEAQAYMAAAAAGKYKGSGSGKQVTEEQLPSFYAQLMNITDGEEAANFIKSLGIDVVNNPDEYNSLWSAWQSGNKKQAAQDQVFDELANDVMAAIATIDGNSTGMSPSAAKAKIDAREKAGVITKEQADYLRREIDKAIKSK